MKKIYKTSDFENVSWHDNFLHGISWKQELKSNIDELILDIDYICEWICEKGKNFTFKISPADLIFYDITDLKININWGDSNFQDSFEGGVPILDITRELVKNPKVHLNKPYYKWTIKLDTLAKDSYISFGSTGFTQTIRKEPILVDKQWLTLDERK